MLTLSFIKQIHIASALISLAGFVVRGIWMIRSSELLQRRWVRISPHIVDTILLLSGIVMVVQLHIYSTQPGWLSAKIIALLVYIVLGSIALKRGKTQAQRTIAWVASLSVFAYILWIAVYREIWPF